jgi:hypothetical protein
MNNSAITILFFLRPAAKNHLCAKMHKVKLNHAFQSAPLEVLICLKQLHFENEQLKSRIPCEHSVHSNSTHRGVIQHQNDSSEISTSQTDLSELLNLCSSQAAQICRLKNEIQVLQTTKFALEREVLVKDLELDRTKVLRSSDESKIKNPHPLEDACTQTVSEQSDSPRYLRVQGQDQSFPEEEILPQSHGRSIYDHMFTPRSRNISHQGVNLDASSIERIIDGITDIIPENTTRRYILYHRDTHN